jgi:hypothetical protein
MIIVVVVGFIFLNASLMLKPLSTVFKPMLNDNSKLKFLLFNLIGVVNRSRGLN